MSIALIQLTDKHTEVVGGLISIFRDFFKNFYIYYISYPSDFCSYYKSNIESSNLKIHLKKDFEIVDKHDIYLFITGIEYSIYKNE